MKNKLEYAKKLGYNVDKKGVCKNPKGKIVGKYLRPDGYFVLTLRTKKGNVLIMVHKLQSYQKYGNKSLIKGVQTRHLNGNSEDNSWDNIAIGSQSDNQMDIPLEKRRLRSSSPKHDHKAICLDYSKGMSYRKIMKKYGISSLGTVSFIIRESMFSEGVID